MCWRSDGRALSQAAVPRRRGAPLHRRACAFDREPLDRRDPAPFRERDLDPGLREYLVESVEDVVARHPRLVFWLEKPCSQEELGQPVRAFFNYELERVIRERRRELREGFLGLLFAFGLIALFLSLSQVLGTMLTGTFGAALKEALIISGWVLLWRPIEVLVYDGIPWRRRRRVLRTLLDAPFDVRPAQ